MICAPLEQFIKEEFSKKELHTNFLEPNLKLDTDLETVENLSKLSQLILHINGTLDYFRDRYKNTKKNNWSRKLLTNVRLVLKQTGGPVRPDLLSEYNGPDIESSKASLQCLMYNMVLDSILQVHSASTSQSD